VLAVALLQPWRTGKKESALLQVDDAGGQIVIRWDHDSPLVRDADRASLEVVDAGVEHRISLDQEDVKKSTLTYGRQSDDVEVRLTLYRPGHQPVREIARFLGQTTPQTSGADPADVQRERDALAAEAKRLREAIRKESLRAEQLREAVRVMENRVRLEEEKARPGKR
jgi:hypothetical protein